MSFREKQRDETDNWRDGHIKAKVKKTWTNDECREIIFILIKNKTEGRNSGWPP